MDDGVTPDSLLTWAVFWVIFVLLALFDVFCLAPKRNARSADTNGESLPARVAFLHVAFWFLLGLIFNAGVLMTFGSEAGVVWFNGYILEYLLSMDNVFFFHVVFTSYATPVEQIYKGLFLGILGAVVLRFVFYIIGGEFFNLSFLVRFIFGFVLMYSGYKTAVSDEDDEDPRDNRCVKFVTRCLPLTQGYDPSGALFAKVQLGAGDQLRVEGGDSQAEKAQVVGSPSIDAVGASFPNDTENPPVRNEGRMVWRGTMLLLVVLVLQVIDVIFAVDSVTAKIAEHDGTFINFSSSAFAMLCLRSLYFVLARLLKYFRFLKYGVAVILVLIGVKLMVTPWFPVSEIYSLGTICGVFVVSIILSVLCPEAYSRQEDEGTELPGLAADTFEAQPKV